VHRQYKSERHLRPCLEALASQTRQPRDVLVWDNASSDQSVGFAEKLGATVLRAPANLGFARAANELIARTTTKYVLLLNPDAWLGPRYVEGSGLRLDAARAGCAPVYGASVVCERLGDGSAHGPRPPEV
jgi:GT2 family glycosyltransferase